ncbi:PIG-L family deacetylase [Streptomyces sp. NRRL F-5755]|uniref:PIG-L family deacetylase n=1 Tax=Streptomyces sp. NRRL F-5755 TaxID=1519475 RepID=UPI0006ADB891|nr:PIG-L family deacetylase [Streptomyces sp. NRRL F-5755]
MTATPGRGPRWTTVVLSPHFDDAALSVAGYLGRTAGPTAVVTVHGGAPAAGRISWWDAGCGFATPEEAYRARLAEDARACALLGAEQMILPNPDSPYREAGDLAGLADFLTALPPQTRVLVPLGTNQPDHTAVRDQALAALAGRPGLAPYVYADLPYTGGVRKWGTDAAVERLAGSDKYGGAYRDLSAAYELRVAHDIRLDEREWAAKRAAVLSYTSQLAPVAVGHGPFLRRPGPLQAELIWEAVPATLDNGEGNRHAGQPPHIGVG